MVEPNKQFGIQASGEKNRNPEFKEGRDKLVNNINNWLKVLADKEPRLSDERLVTETLLGSVNPVVNMLGVSRKIGTSLRGDGVATPIEFQKVKHNDKDEVEIVHITGTDPVASMVRESKYLPGYRQEKVASFGLEFIGTEGQQNYFEYVFGGDGSVIQRYITDEGVHTARDLRTVEDIEMAFVAFSQLADATNV